MEVEDCNLLMMFQLPPRCSEQCLEQFYAFVREQVKKGHRITVMVKRPIDIQERVQAAMEKRRRNLDSMKSPEQVAAEKKAEIQNLIQLAKNTEDQSKVLQYLIIAQNLNLAFPEEYEVDAEIQKIKIFYTYKQLNELESIIDAEEKAITAIKRTQTDRFDEDLLNIRINKINRLQQNGDQFLQNSQYEEAIMQYENSIEIIKVINQPVITKELEILIRTNLGFTYQMTKNYHLSLSCYQSILEMLEEIQIRERINALNNLAKVYQEMNENDKAISYFEKCIELLRKLGTDRSAEEELLFEKLLNTIGILHSNANRHNFALPYFKESCELARKIFKNQEEQVKLASRMFTLGETFRIMKQYENALEAYTISMNTRRVAQNEETPQLGKAQMQVGMMLIALKKYEPAKSQLQNSLNIFNSLDKHSENQQIQLTIAQLYYQLSECYKQMKEPEGCLQNLEHSYKIRKEYLGLEHQLTQQSILGLSSQYFNLNNSTKALEWLILLEESQEKAYGTYHTLVGQSCQNIAIVFCENKEFEKSIQYSKKAVAIFKKTLGQNDQTYIKARDKYEEIKKKAQEWSQKLSTKLQNKDELKENI